MTPHKLALAASTALICAGTASYAAPAIGLTGDKTLVMFDTNSPAETKTVDVTGVERLVGIDLRPANGVLVGVTPDSTVVTIDPATGAATVMSKMDKPLEIGDAPVIVDFDPAADRLRYMTGTTNHRVNIDTGEVQLMARWPMRTATCTRAKLRRSWRLHTPIPMESRKRRPLDVDATIGALIRQTKPNDGTLAAIGKFGIDTAETGYAFDIQTTADGTNTAWLVNGRRLYTVNLENGMAAMAGEIGGSAGSLRDITIMPAM